MCEPSETDMKMDTENAEGSKTSAESGENCTPSNETINSDGGKSQEVQDAEKTNAENGSVDAIKQGNEDSTGEKKEGDSTDEKKEPSSETTGDPDNTPFSWDTYELMVGGLPSKETKNLKQVLVSTLGEKSHRIKPRQKTDAGLHIQFQSKQEMGVAKTLLQNFMNYKLNVQIVHKTTSQKRKAELEDESTFQSPKKLKRLMCTTEFLELPYESQVAAKTSIINSTFKKLGTAIHYRFPEYHGTLSKSGGLPCPVESFRSCSVKGRYFSRCKFVIGKDNDTGVLSVGFRGEDGKVTNMSSVMHSYPDHVIEAAQVFEKVIQKSEKRMLEKEGECKIEFWHSLVIRTNRKNEVMLLAFVQCPQEVVEDRMKCWIEDLNEYYNNGEGKPYPVASLYTKQIHTTPSLSIYHHILGAPHIEETIMDLKFNISPEKLFWINTQAASMVCKVLKKLVHMQGNCEQALQVGFVDSVIGLYLSRIVQKVFVVDEVFDTDMAKKEAELNEIENIEFLSGKPDTVIPELKTKLEGNVCAVIICSSSHTSKSVEVMEHLRRTPQVTKVLLVTEAFRAHFEPIFTLAKPHAEEDMGTPFFPAKAIPVDHLPGKPGCMALILLTRLPSNFKYSEGGTPGRGYTKKSMKKSSKYGKWNQARKGYLLPFPRFGRGQFFQQNYNEGLLGAYGRGRFQNDMGYGMNRNFRFPGPGMQWNSFEQYPRPFPRPGNEAVGRMGGIGDEHRLRQIIAEEQRKLMEEDRHRKRIEDQTELAKIKSNLKSDVMQDLIADSLKEAAIPQLSSDAAVRLKNVITEAIKSIASSGQGRSGDVEMHGGKMSDEYGPNTRPGMQGRWNMKSQDNYSGNPDMYGGRSYGSDNVFGKQNQNPDQSLLGPRDNSGPGPYSDTWNRGDYGWNRPPQKPQSYMTYSPMDNRQSLTYGGGSRSQGMDSFQNVQRGNNYPYRKDNIPPNAPYWQNMNSLR